MNDSLELFRVAVAARYRVDRELGSGGMATVYLAEDIRHQRQVAIKVFRPELALTLGPRRFLNEVQVAARLQHPNILALLDSGEANGFLYYVMPFVDGRSLRERLLDEKTLSIRDSVRILMEVVDALAEAHRQGIVHRDVKPDNIMLSGRHALVMDFGIAKAVNESAIGGKVTTMGFALGTPAYMAPEQTLGGPDIDQRSDIYAVGVMAYEMLTGSVPFVEADLRMLFAAHLTVQPEKVRSAKPEVSPALEEIVLKCLAKQPRDRWQSAEDLLSQLESLDSGKVHAASADYSSRVPRSRSRFVVLGGLIAGALFIAAIWLKRLASDDTKSWVYEHAIPEIERQIERGNWEAAYSVAKQAEAIVK